MIEKDNNGGTLYLVATPIGNMLDLSPRAVQTLKEVDIILAEDTRHFRKLATNFDIKTRVISNYEQNEKQRLTEALNYLNDGKDLALVSDAGTPCISDPGFLLVRACRESNTPIITIPGPCALIAAISSSGLPTHKFTFEGFLPVKKGKREKQLKEACEKDYPTIFYESNHRILSTLEILVKIAPEQKVYLGRELTKKFEESTLSTSTQLFDYFQEKKSIKGEFVLIIGGKK